jgi:hypothetical protein
MAKTTNSKRRGLTDKRVKKRFTIAKLASNATAKFYSKHRGTDIQPPRSIARAKGDRLCNFQRQISNMKLNDMEVEFKNTSIGCAAFATQNIPGHTTLRNVTGRFVGNVSKASATRMRSSVAVIDDVTGKEKCYKELIGVISLFNHACQIHANCTTRFTDPQYDFQVVQTRRRVTSGKELTIVYDPACNLPCRSCKTTKG